MRDYAKVSPLFWNGETGKKLKKAGPEAVIVGLYLMTCQHANMLGLYFLNRTYIAVDTGLSLEGASEGLARACEAGFCRYDDASEVVWVVEMAKYQVADALDEKDNRCKGIQREFDMLPENPFFGAFYERYGAAFHMTSARGQEAPKTKPLGRGSKAPTKPRTGTGTGTGEKPGFAEFWSVWPKSERKGGKSECLEFWSKQNLEPESAQVVAHVKAMGASEAWRKEGGSFIPAPIVYLRGRRWDGAEVDAPAAAWAGAI